MKRLVDVVHIGFPKTGTTFLQVEVFKRIEGLYSLAKGNVVDGEYRGIVDRLIGADPFDFDPVEFHERFARLHRRHGLEEGFDGVRLLSHEHLMGDLHGGWRGQQLIERVRQAFNPKKVLITIREQKAMIESVYRYYVTSGGGLHVRELLYKRTSPSVDLYGNRELFRRFRYDLLIEHCFRQFGRDNVKVIPFEYLKQDPQLFVDEFCGFLELPSPAGVDWAGLRINESISYTGTKCLRAINQVVGTPMSDSPFLRLVPRMYTTFISQFYGPVDRGLFAHLAPRQRFINRPVSWRWRRAAKRVLAGLLKATGKADAVIGSGMLFDIARYLDWPDVERVFRERELAWNPEVDGRSIATDIDRAFGPSNRRTVELTGLPLRELGYPMAGEETDDLPDAAQGRALDLSLQTTE